MLFAFFLCFTNCTFKSVHQYNEIAGLYVEKDKEGSYPTLTLNPDMTFDYKDSMLLGSTIVNYWTTGTWSLNNNKILLSSELQREDEKKNTFNILTQRQTGQDSITFYIVGEDKEPLPLTSCYYCLDSNPKMYGGITDRFGLLKFPKNNADTIFLYSYGYKVARIPIKAKDNDYFKLQMIEYPVHYEYFNDEEWTVKGNRIYPSMNRAYLKVFIKRQKDELNRNVP